MIAVTGEFDQPGISPIQIVAETVQTREPRVIGSFNMRTADVWARGLKLAFRLDCRTWLRTSARSQPASASRDLLTLFMIRWARARALDFFLNLSTLSRSLHA